MNTTNLKNGKKDCTHPAFFYEKGKRESKKNVGKIRRKDHIAC